MNAPSTFPSLSELALSRIKGNAEARGLQVALDENTLMNINVPKYSPHLGRIQERKGPLVLFEKPLWRPVCQIRNGGNRIPAYLYMYAEDHHATVADVFSLILRHADEILRDCQEDIGSAVLSFRITISTPDKHRDKYVDYIKPSAKRIIDIFPGMRTEITVTIRKKGEGKQKFFHPQGQTISPVADNNAVLMPKKKLASRKKSKTVMKNGVPWIVFRV